MSKKNRGTELRPCRSVDAPYRPWRQDPSRPRILFCISEVDHSRRECAFPCATLARLYLRMQREKHTKTGRYAR